MFIQLYYCDLENFFWAPSLSSFFLSVFVGQKWFCFMYRHWFLCTHECNLCFGTLDIFNTGWGFQAWPFLFSEGCSRRIYCMLKKFLRLPVGHMQCWCILVILLQMSGEAFNMKYAPICQFFPVKLMQSLSFLKALETSWFNFKVTLEDTVCGD